jgi:reactive intermediate/imine deaminase
MREETMVKAIFLAAGLLAGATAVNAADQTVYYRSPDAAAAKLPFSDATQVGNILYLSGQVGNLPGQMRLADGGIAGQTKQAMENIGAVLKSRGLGYDDVFKCTILLADIKNWAEFNKVYVTYFKPDRLPSRSALGASGLALNAAVEVECWANTAH